LEPQIRQAFKVARCDLKRQKDWKSQMATFNSDEVRMAEDALIPVERIKKAILLVRGQKVMLDRDLASLYGVATGVLNQAMKRNRKRFPADFMFQLSREEMEDWKSQPEKKVEQFRLVRPVIDREGSRGQRQVQR
jgi:hypothetical protein